MSSNDHNIMSKSTTDALTLGSDVNNTESTTNVLFEKDPTMLTSYTPTQEETSRFRFEVENMTRNEFMYLTFKATNACIQQLVAWRDCQRDLFFDTCSSQQEAYLSCFRKHRGFLRSMNDFDEATESLGIRNTDDNDILDKNQLFQEYRKTR